MGRTIPEKIALKKVLTIQDISCFGQCSITVALPILSAYGIETAILPSAVMSTHTGGFTNFTVHDLTDEMPKILEHWISCGIKFDAIYTGYIGDTRQFDIILKAKKYLLEEGGKLIVDPAMADNGILYKALDKNIVDGMRKIVSEADVIMPNLTEAAFLLNEEYKEECDEEAAEVILKKLSLLGPEISILTGVSPSKEAMGASAYIKSEDRNMSYFGNRQKNKYHGTGDVFSSVLVSNIMNSKSLEESLEEACEFVIECIKNTDIYPSHTYGVRFESVLANR